MTKLIAIVPSADYLYTCRFSSNEGTRHHLNGVFVDAANRRLVATDGHRLGILTMDASDMHIADGAASFILTNSKDLQRACKSVRHERLWFRCYDDRLEVVAGGSASDSTDVLPIAEPAARLVATLPGTSVYIDGTFPDYTRVVPQTCTGLTTEDIKAEGKVTGQQGYGVNADYLASMKGPNTKQANIKVLPNGGAPWLALNEDPRFIGVVMPMRYGITPAEGMARIGAALGWSKAAIHAAA